MNACTVYIINTVKLFYALYECERNFGTMVKLAKNWEDEPDRTPQIT
jgi:hypothetical protein